MPIGIVSDSDFDIELGRTGSNGSKSDPKTRIPAPSSDLVPSVSIVEKPHRGRSEGDMNVPDALRKIIGEEAVINGRASALEIASQFGISASSVSAYAKGATSTTTYDQPKSGILSHINKSRSRAIKRASRTLNSALGSITQDKLDYADAKDLSTIAKDMSVIIRNLEPPASPESIQTNQVNGPQFVIYAPQFKKEESFDVIQVNE